MEQLNIIREVAEDILQEKNLDSLIEKAIERITNILQAERATFYFFKEQTQELWSYVAKGLEVDEIRIPLGQGIAGRCAQEKKVINIPDTTNCEFFDNTIDKKTGYHTKSVICMPFFDKKNNLLGVIQVINRKEGDLAQVDEELFKIIAFYIGVALENVMLYQENESFFRSTLYALAGAIDAKDPVTAGHSHRVAYYSVRIAKELGYLDDEIRVLEYSAYLHDIGKIAIPDRILHKKKKLNVKEYAVIKKHPLYTLQILKNIIFPKESRGVPQIASCHHEFLDGSGYPLGLKEEQIGIFSRIIAVADVFDALVSFDRPYKKNLTVNKALSILKEEAVKKHLDKKIVDLFTEKELYKYERRRYRRIDLDTTISYQIIPQRKIIKDGIREKTKSAASDLDILKYKSGKTSNISEGGILFVTRQYMPVGTYLDLEVNIPSRKIKCIGKVIWIEKIVGTMDYNIGVNFVNLPKHIKKFLAKVPANIG